MQTGLRADREPHFSRREARPLNAHQAPSHATGVAFGLFILMSLLTASTAHAQAQPPWTLAAPTLGHTSPHVAPSRLRLTPDTLKPPPTDADIDFTALRAFTQDMPDERALDDDPLNNTADGEPAGEGSPEQRTRRTRRVVRNGAYLLYFYEHDPLDKETLLHILGLYWHRDNPEWRLNLMLPLGATWQWKKHPERWGLVTPLAWHSAGKDATYSGAWLWHRYDSPQRRINTLLPLYLHHVNKRTGDHLHVLGPAYLRHNQADAWSAGVLPLFWTGNGPQGFDLNIPLALTFVLRTPQKTRLISPFYAYSQDRDTGHTDASVPLLMTFWNQHDDPSKTRYAIQFPLLFKFWDRDSAFTMSASLIYGYERGDVRFGSLFPVYFGYEDKDVSFRLLVPALYARHKDKQTGDTFGMLGPLYAWRRQAAFGFGAWPLFQTMTDQETGQRRTLLLPLYAAQDSDQGERPRRSFRLFTPLLYARYHDLDEQRRFLMAGPLYYNKKRSSVALGVAPLFFHWHDHDLKRSFTLVPGLYADNQGPDWRTRHWGPAFWRERPNRSTWGLLPLGVWDHDRAQNIQSLMLAPMFYLSHGPQRRRLLAGPFWRFRDKGTANDGLLPLYIRHRRPDGSGFFAMPGAIDVRDNSPDGYHFTWILNAMRMRRHSGRTTTVVAPLFVDSQDDLTGDRWTLALPWILISGNEAQQRRNIFALPFLYSRNPQRTWWSVPPLAFGYKDDEVDTWAVPPLAFYRQSLRPGGGRFVMGPLLFGRYTRPGRHDTAERHRTNTESRGDDGIDLGWIGPYVWSDRPTHRLRVFAPLLLDWQDYERQQAFMTVFPLYFRWQERVDDGEREFSAVVPLTFSYKETFHDGRRRQLTGLGPLFAYGGDKGSGFGLFPLFWHDRARGEEGQSGHDILFPLVWHFFDEREGTSSTLVGPAYHFKNSEGRRFGLAPLYFHGTRQTPQGETGYDATLPLYWYRYGANTHGDPTATLITPLGYLHAEGESRRHGLLLNYWFERAPDRHTDFFFPWVYRHKTKAVDRLTVAPFYHHHKTPTRSSRFILPLYYHVEDSRRDAELTWAGPWISSRHGGTKTETLLPLFYQRRSDNGDLFRLAPLFLQTKNGDTGSQFLLGGPFWHRRAGNGATQAGLFPLLWWGESADGERGHFMLPPLVWHFDDGPDEVWNVVTPLWHHRTARANTAGVFPLVWWEQEANSPDGHTIVAPLYWRFVGDEGRRRTTVVGPAWSHRHPEGYAMGLAPLGFVQDDRSTDTFRLMAGPAYYSNVQGTRRGGLFPLYHRRVDESGFTLNTTAGLAWWWDDPDRGHSGAVVGPAYHIRHQRGSDTGLAGLAHVSTRDQGDLKAWLMPVAYLNRENQGEDLTVIAGPAFYQHTEEDQRWALLPLAGGWRDKITGAQGHGVLPLYYHESRPEGHTFLSPLFYHRRQGNEWSAWSGPYFGGGDDESSHHALLPIFYGRRSNDGSSVDVALPLYVNVKKPGGRAGAAVLFPFYWHFYDEDEDSDAKVLFPFYWRFQNDKRDFMLAGPFFRSKRQDRLTHGLVPFYLYTTDPHGYSLSLVGGVFAIDHDNETGDNDYQVLWIPF